MSAPFEPVRRAIDRQDLPYPIYPIISFCFEEGKLQDVSVIFRDGADQLGEGPLWSTRDNALYWVDILGQKIHRYTSASRQVVTWDVPEMIGWIIERERRDGFVAGFQSGFAFLSLDPLGICPIHDPEPDLPANRLNDAKADAAGRIWAGSMAVNASDRTGSLYCLDADGRCRQVDTGYRITNGPAFSLDGRWLYHTDTGDRTVYRFALQEDGTLGARQAHIAFASDWGNPDGMTVDAEGCLWIACWGGAQVARFSPEGDLVRTIPLPASQITSCAFGGEAMDTMFVTSAAIGVDEKFGGALFEVDPGCRGVAAFRFAG